MNLLSIISTKNTSTRIPVALFSGFAVFLLWFFLSIWPLASHLGDFYRESSVIFLLLYLISLYGCLKLPSSFPERQGLKNYCLPFTLVTVSGILLCAIRLILTGTMWEWPVVHICDLLMDMNILLLTAAMTLLLLPFVREMKPRPVFSYGILVFASLISAGIVFQIILTDILPLFDPEFIWSEFWIFGSAWFNLDLLRSQHFGPGTLLTGILSLFYVVFGMPVLGFISLRLLRRATLQDLSGENTQVES